MTVVIKIQGGLGNQMFQYAFSRALPTEERVYFDLAYFDEPGSMSLELDRVFGISLPERDTPAYRKTRNLLYSNKVLRKLYTAYKVARRVVSKVLCRNSRYIETKLSYNPAALSHPYQYYDGYFQSYKYFESCKHELERAYSFPSLDQGNQKIAEMIAHSNSVSVHVRRGDYLEHPLYKGICDEDYYTEAIATISSRVADPHFFVFSNDIEWCKKHLSFLSAQVTFVSGNGGENSYKDMQLMSLCKHNIICNSSFSWWGAYLNKNKHHTVLRPNKWIHDENTKIDDICPPAWLVVN